MVYLQGNIHPYEMEGKEALLMLAREILLGRLTGLLDKLIIIICPNFNVDGNDTLSFGDGTPAPGGVWEQLPEPQPEPGRGHASTRSKWRGSTGRSSTAGTRR